MASFIFTFAFRICFIAVAGMLVAPVCEGSAVASEYYVVKSRSGFITIVNHQPKRAASILKGPFMTKEEAEKAMKSVSDTKSPDTRAK